MKKGFDLGDFVLIDGAGRLDYAIFVDDLPFDNMCKVKIVKEKSGKKYKTPDKKTSGIHITKKKYLVLILNADELQETTEFAVEYEEEMEEEG